MALWRGDITTFGSTPSSTLPIPRCSAVFNQARLHRQRHPLRRGTSTARRLRNDHHDARPRRADRLREGHPRIRPAGALRSSYRRTDRPRSCTITPTRPPWLAVIGRASTVHASARTFAPSPSVAFQRVCSAIRRNRPLALPSTRCGAGFVIIRDVFDLVVFNVFSHEDHTLYEQALTSSPPRGAVS